MARAGYSAKGAVYAVVGVLAVQAALGLGGATTGAKGAIHHIGRSPFGQVLLLLLALGLGCYAMWRILAACLDAEGRGSSMKAIAVRAGIFISGIIHAGLAIAAVAAFQGGKGSSDNAEGWTARLLRAPFGPWLVLGIAAGVGVAGLTQWVRAAKGTYRNKFDLEGAAASQRGWIERVAQLGLAARGLVFLIIGYFLARAGWQSDASEARGFGDALDTLASQPQGTWLLGIAALGLFCYGIYCVVVAIYGRFNRG